MPISEPRRGVAIVLAVVVMSVTLATALVIASIFIGEFRISTDVVQSTRAILAADSGVERTIFARQREAATGFLVPPPSSVCSSSPYKGMLPAPGPGLSRASYCTEYDFDASADRFGIGVTNDTAVIRSFGTVQEVSRAFEVTIAP